MSKKVKIYMGLPTMGNVCAAQVNVLERIRKRYADKVELVYPTCVVKRMFHDFARNAIVDEFLDSDCDILWFLDSDVAPPEHILDLVVEHGDRWKMAGAPYGVFMTPPGEKNPHVVYTVYHRIQDKLCPGKVPKEGLDYVDGIATGCIFLKREIFKDLKKPYFEFKYREHDRHIEQGEDLGFCKKVSDLGYKFFIDYSMVCKHYKTLCLLEVNNYAIEYANKSVLAYDASIRPQIEKLEQLLRSKMDSSARNKSNIILPDDLR